LRQCEALAPIRSEALPQISEDAAIRGAQIAERAFWMRRDWAQADTVKDACNKLGEVVALVDQNNAGVED
jgi:hypothetical protein